MRKTSNVFFISAILFLSGCSALGGLTNLLPTSKGVEATAQAGGTNTKQGIGLTANTDQSNDAESTVKDSTVGTVDSSSGKKVQASSISAGLIKANTIQIVNGETSNNWVWVSVVAGFLALIGYSLAYYEYKKRSR